MLTEINPAYFELVSSSGAQKAQKLIVAKAQAELELQQQNPEISQSPPESAISK
ncbi:MAG: hypothetical protein AAFR77_01520 [Cyanobacteria bacterium J06631_2]